MRSSITASSTWARTVALAVTVFASVTLADVQFIEPAAGANLTAGQIDVQWQDSGIKPLISELTQYTLSLMVGGNDLDDMASLLAQPASSSNTNTPRSNLWSPSNRRVATLLDSQPEEQFPRASLPKYQMDCTLRSLGLYEIALADLVTSSFFRMTSTKQAGGVLINYSDRFSILGLTGDTALNIKQAALALNGDIAGPPVIGENVSSTTASSVGGSTSTPSSVTVSLTGPKVPTRTHFTSTEASNGSSAELTESPDNDNTSSGLSKGATVAIAVAVTLAITAVFAGLAWHLYARKRKRQNEIHEIAPGTVFHHKPTSESSAEDLASPVSPGDLTPSKSLWTHTSELSSENMVYEAGSGARRPELDISTVVVRYELEGSTPVTPVDEKKDFHV